MFSKYGACDAAAELDGLQQITPEHLHHPVIPSISRWSQWGEVVEEWVWSARSRCDWVTQFRAKWTVMISDYINVINRNKLLYIPFVRRWYNSNNNKKKNGFQPESPEQLSNGLPAWPMPIQFNSCQWRSLFRAGNKLCVAFERWSCKAFIGIFSSGWGVHTKRIIIPLWFIPDLKTLSTKNK